MFLLRNAHAVVPDLPTISENYLLKDVRAAPKAASTLEGLIAEDPFLSEDVDDDSDINGEAAGSSSQDQIRFGNHSDVLEDEGWITIPKGKIPDDWFEASDILQLRSLDRSFVFSGEQLHILICLSAIKQDEEIISPFKVAAVMSKNDNSTQKRKVQHEISDITFSVNGQVDKSGNLNREAGFSENNGQTLSTAENLDPELDITVTKSLLQKEGHKQKTEALLESFRRSNFFVRIADSDEPLWSKRLFAESTSTKLEMAQGKFHSNDEGSKKGCHNFHSSVIDQGSFDCSASSGVARNNVRCCSLPSGDIVVLLQVNVAVSNLKDPILEVFQFEKYGAIASYSENSSDLELSNHDDPCGELLNWLLPLDRTLPPPRPISPPLMQAPPLTTQRTTSSSHSGSQIFSFGHFRSYSMSSLPQVSTPATTATPYNSRPANDLEDLDRFTLEMSKNQDLSNEGLLSFRGVSLVPERFSVHCGLEGIYLPGKRWRRKLEIIQPLEIHSFSVACSTEDVLCVQIKNVSPARLPDITIFLDSITIIYEEASKGCPPFCLPITSIETGSGHTLPNLPLRRGEEHSFILKPATKIGGNQFGHNVANNNIVSHSKVGAGALSLTSKTSEVRKNSPNVDDYAVLVSCRCNYTESKLFFKHRTNWRPQIAKDLMISVVSEMSKDTAASSTSLPQLPFQVLTLHASNLTSEDLTLTVLAPLSSASSPSVVPLSSTPRSPINSFACFPEVMGRVAGDKSTSSMQRLSSMPAVTETQKVNDASSKRSISLAQRVVKTSDFISNTDLGCTHLWLQSTVPLGLVPAHSSATVKLELLPLTDGIISLDTLQVAVQEKGVTYTPEEPLKIYATSSIATGIL